MAKSIALVVVMALVNLFMFYAIYKTWLRVNEKVEKYFLNNTAHFGPVKEIIETEVPFVMPEKKEEQVSSSVYVQDSSNVVHYLNENFASDYKKVKQNMEFSKKEIIQDVIEQTNLDPTYGEKILKVKEQLDFDTVYELSTLSSKQQVEILKAVFDQDGLDLLNTYLDSNRDVFDVIEFSDYIKQLSLKEDPTVYVKTGWKNDNFDNLNESVTTVYDKEITEGVKIVHKDKLYDYSI